MLLPACLMSVQLTAQICQGSLGLNIFEEGDFGSGALTIFPTDPGIAPGYNYTTNVPPDDGFYVLTNNTGNWLEIWPTWLEIGDNSNDPQGYMMVVNASFSPGIFYVETIDNLCENTVYEFSADMINLIRIGVADHILPNISFFIDGEPQFSTGSVPQDEAWHTYGFTFVTDSGQTSLQLSLRNNAPGGIGNDIALDNIVFRPCGPAARIRNNIPGKVCENATLLPSLSAEFENDPFDPYILWQISADDGATWQDITGASEPVLQITALGAGIYQYRYLLASSESNLSNEKCRVVSEVEVVEVVPIRYLIADSICQGLTFALGQNTFGTSGIYHDSLISTIGCDSIVTLNLTVVTDPGMVATFDHSDPSCPGEEDGTIALATVEGGAGPYIYSVDEMGPYMAEEIQLVGAGDYAIIVEDRYGCSADVNIEILDPMQFALDPIGPITLPLGHSTQVQVTGNYAVQTVQWSPATGLLDCDTCASIVLRPPQSVQYQVTATNVEGCAATTEVLVEVLEDRLVYIPDIFTPNGDGVNDTWTITADPQNVLMIKKIIIANRWGDILFKRTDINVNDPLRIWDGRFNGEEAEAGVYTYLVEMAYFDQKILTEGGTLTLLR